MSSLVIKLSVSLQDFDFPDTTILTWVDVDDLDKQPLVTWSIVFFGYHYISYSYVPPWLHPLAT